MNNWSELDLQKWKEKSKRELETGYPNPIPDEGSESIIQQKIVDWAKKRGYPCLSLKPNRKFRGEFTPGWPDITLSIKNKTIYFELKSKSGTLRDKQIDIKRQLLSLGHEYYNPRSFKAFLAIMENRE